MCGIFGAIGKGYNRSIIRSLALINRERGTHSLGMFSGYNVWKMSGDPLYSMGTRSFNDWFSGVNSWFLVGHTRYATRGKRTKRNAHPFRRGRYIGVHNGKVDACPSYRVDSIEIWDRLNAAKGDYQEAWADLGGYWGLAWYDGRHVWLQAHNQDLTVVEVGGVLYFSSDPDHLAACTGRDDWWSLAEGDTWQFTKGACVEKPAFVSNTDIEEPDEIDHFDGRSVYPDWDEITDFSYRHGLEWLSPDEQAHEYYTHRAAWFDYVEEDNSVNSG